MTSSRGILSGTQMYPVHLGSNASVFHDNNTFPLVDVTDVSDPMDSVEPPSADILSIAGLSVLFFIIVFFGVLGNALVIVVILIDTKMRRSVTNLLIVNLAIADLTIMVFGVPEIVMFMKDRGWLLGPVACRANRFILVVALYCSVLSLVTLCFERFIAIVFPLKVNKWCTKKSTMISIFIIWIIAFLCGSPVAIFNRIGGPPHSAIQYCQMILPGGDKKTFLIYKYLESICFYFLPMIIQIVLYSIIAKRLFASNEQLRMRFQMRPYRSTISSSSNASAPSSSDQQRASNNSSDTIRARRGVVKMLVCCVLLYFVSYSPFQAHLIYDTVSYSTSKVFSSRQFFIFVHVITHINSAGNPFLYGIFSQNFRRQFKRFLMIRSCRKGQERTAHRQARASSFSSSRFLSTRSMNSRTVASRV